jgi:hypothetical protein
VEVEGPGLWPAACAVEFDMIGNEAINVAWLLFRCLLLGVEGGDGAVEESAFERGTQRYVHAKTRFKKV